MDPTRFDRFAVLLAEARSRRAALRLLAAGVASAVVFARSPRPAAAAICPQRVPRPGYTPTANGCGPDGYDWFVPDAWRPRGGGRTVRFTDACSAHDVCYGTCNKDRDNCDDRFLDDLKRACRKVYPPDGTRRERDLYHRCRDRAYMYYTAVSEKGLEAYEDAQKEACVCCNQGDRGPKCGDRCCASDETCVDGRCQLDLCKDCSTCTDRGYVCCPPGSNKYTNCRYCCPAGSSCVYESLYGCSASG